MNAVVDFPVKPEARDYLACFARDASEPGWLAARRQQAMTRFAEIGFPSRKSEAWRYIDLNPIGQMRPASGRAASIPRTRLAGLGLPAVRCRLVLVDGRFVAELSDVALPGGVWLGSTVEAVRQRPELVRQALDVCQSEPIAELDAAFFSDGFVLDVAPGVRLDAPILIVHLAAGANERSLHTRSFVRLGSGSEASLIEIHAGENKYWRNDVAAVELGVGARLDQVVLIEEGPEGVHLGATNATLDAGARLSAFALLIGGRAVRHQLSVTMAGEAARCEIAGAFVAATREEANFVTAIDHAAPGCRTDELVKGVAAGRGHGAFQGRIAVRKDAQKTDAHQLSRNLLIGRRAVIDTKPELEIDADDVKCSHGASVGDLDDAALFYLRSRGIPAQTARRMLIEGFLSEPVEAVGNESLRAYLLRRLAVRLGALEE